jgi:hypothetical protein
VVKNFTRVSFAHSRMQAFDGVIQFQAMTVFPRESAFTLSEEKLAAALSLIAPAEKISESAEFVRMVRGPLSVRLRKLDASEGFFDPFKMSKNAKKAEGFLDVLKLVAPFLSEDATRAWSLSVLIKNGYAWSTNNLALVRAPYSSPFGKIALSIPAPAVKLLVELPSIDYIELESDGHITLSSGKLLYRFAQASSEWPDLEKMFDAMPKKLPLLPSEMREAAATSSRLSDRFTSLSLNKVESQGAALESTYEVAFEKGEGLFSAKLLTLIADKATHADFSFYPKPIFFRGEGFEGTAIGAQKL